MKIQIKETSKSGVIANINGVFGQVKDGGESFAPYTADQLATKTAYKNGAGWKEYGSLDAYKAERVAFNEGRAQRNTEMAAKIDAMKIEDYNRLKSLIAAGPIPATAENIKLLANHLNDQNWGGWDLPKMTIGYSANQYDCDGTPATTIVLDEPISGEFFENEKMFKVGGKRGHLNKYTSL